MEQAHTVYLDIFLNDAYDLSGFRYIVADVRFTGNDSLAQLTGMWMEVFSKRTAPNKKVRLTAYGYAGNNQVTPMRVTEDIWGRETDEWFTVWFPIHENHAYDSHPEKSNFTSVRVLRYQLLYEGPQFNEKGSPELIKGIPHGAAFAIGNVRAADGVGEDGALTIPIMDDGVKYGSLCRVVKYS
jgi:hypothetical protein